MKKLFTSLLSLSSVLALSLPGTVAFAATDFIDYGFTKVVTEKKIQVGEVAQIGHSGINIQIPEGAFTHDVLFQVLEGEVESFQPNAPIGERVIMTFALRVTDLETNELIGTFNQPIMFSFKDREVNAESKYYNVKLDGTFVNNNAATTIDGRTLSHPVGGAPVGWAITSLESSIVDDDSWGHNRHRDTDRDRHRGNDHHGRNGDNGRNDDHGDRG